METALETAKWLLGQVLNKLSDDLVKAYVSSTELGPNLDRIKTEMQFTRALLVAAQRRDVAGNPALQGLLEMLGKKADEADDALDELHYFMIQDKHDRTRDATLELGDGLAAQAQHVRHAARHTSGNWLSCCFSCCRPQEHVAAADDGDVVHNHHVHDGKLPFDRVTMSNNIKQLIEELHSMCTPVSDLLKIVSANSNPQPHYMPAFTERPHTSSHITQDKLFGRDAIFQKTIEDIIIAKDSGKTLSVLPIVGPGGIGKTTFAQHLYNHTRIKEHFIVKVWICVSTNFDVLRLTKEILSCLPATENASDKTANETTNLDQLQKSIEQRLKSKRFLIVLDDIWECRSSDEWEKLLAPLKKDETIGNMILVTTRFPKIVDMVTKEMLVYVCVLLEDFVRTQMHKMPIKERGGGVFRKSEPTSTHILQTSTDFNMASEPRFSEAIVVATSRCTWSC